MSAIVALQDGEDPPESTLLEAMEAVVESRPGGTKLQEHSMTLEERAVFAELLRAGIECLQANDDVADKLLEWFRPRMVRS